jgi:hypothetical protein
MSLDASHVKVERRVGPADKLKSFKDSTDQKEILGVTLVGDDGARIESLGGGLKVDATQIDLYNIFVDTLKELKKINIQLALMTDSLITNQDVEV